MRKNQITSTIITGALSLIASGCSNNKVNLLLNGSLDNGRRYNTFTRDGSNILIIYEGTDIKSPEEIRAYYFKGHNPRDFYKLEVTDLSSDSLDNRTREYKRESKSYISREQIIKGIKETEEISARLNKK
ncbi:MAG: hypothetical protein Q7S74_04880 [Nanoarchaeota archaeon]|nr:hypothetical protein [Nanoarchaeota archaeon]